MVTEEWVLRLMTYKIIVIIWETLSYCLNDFNEIYLGFRELTFKLFKYLLNYKNEWK
jgi:hypothetical protein